MRIPPAVLVVYAPTCVVMFICAIKLFAAPYPIFSNSPEALRGRTVRGEPFDVLCLLFNLDVKDKKSFLRNYLMAYVTDCPLHRPLLQAASRYVASHDTWPGTLGHYTAVPLRYRNGNWFCTPGACSFASTI